MLGIFRPFYETEFSSANYKKATDWATEKFGKEDEISVLLDEAHKCWVKKVVTMRNVVEHPDSPEGPLVFRNVELINKDHPPFFKAPTWQLKDEQESTIVSDMEVIIENILTLSEDLLMAVLKKIPTSIKLAFYGISEEKRDSKCPKRITVNLHPDEAKKLEAAIKEAKKKH